MTGARLGSVTVACGDPGALGRFWAELLDGELVHTDERIAAVRAGSIWITALRIDDHHAPSWPGGDRPQPVHLDLAVDDLDREMQRAATLGARVEPDQPSAESFRVLRDPAGNLFCLSVRIPE